MRFWWRTPALAQTRFQRKQIEGAGGDWETAQLCNSSIDKLIQGCASEIKAADFARSKLAWKFAVFRQAISHRLIDLAEGTIALWTARNWIGAIIMARALLETVALTHWITWKTQQAIEEKSIENLDQLAMNITFGSKSDERRLSDEYEAINILTAIDRLQKTIPSIRRHYDILSEYAHPNASGVYFFYAGLNVDNDTTSLSRNRPIDREVVRLLLAASISIAWAETRIELLDDLVARIQVLQEESDVSHPSVAWAPDTHESRKP